MHPRTRAARILTPRAQEAMATAQKIWWVISELAVLAEGVSVGQQEENVDGGGCERALDSTCQVA